MILVAFAMREEATDFVAWLRHHDMPVEVAYFGVGEAAVREKLPDIFEKFRPDAMICAGFAGALTPDLAIGEVFLAKDRTCCGWQPALKIIELFSTTRVVDSAADRLQMQIYSGASAVDMETATVAEIARKRRIPFLTIRVIIDTPDEPIPLPWTVSYDLARQRARPLATIGWLLRHPWRLGDFLNFLKTLKLARRNLTNALAAALKLADASRSTLDSPTPCPEF